MRPSPATWRKIHDAKNDLTAAVILLERARDGGAVDVPQIEALIRSAVERMNDFELDSGGGWAPMPREVVNRAPRPGGGATGQMTKGRSRRPSSVSRPL